MRLQPLITKYTSSNYRRLISKEFVRHSDFPYNRLLKLSNYDKPLHSRIVKRNACLKNSQWSRNPALECFADGRFVRHCSGLNFDGGSSGQMPNMMRDAKKLYRDEISSSLARYAELAGGRENECTANCFY